MHSDQIKEKEEETSELSNQYSAADADYSQKKSNLKKLLNEAEKIAPKDEWHERLDQDDLPVDLEGVDEALDEAESKVNSITDNPHVMRQYEERKKEIAKLQDQLDEAGGEKDMKKKQLESKMAKWKVSSLSAVGCGTTYFTLLQTVVSSLTSRSPVLPGKYREECQ